MYSATFQKCEYISKAFCKKKKKKKKNGSHSEFCRVHTTTRERIFVVYLPLQTQTIKHVKVQTKLPLCLNSTRLAVMGEKKKKK